MSAAAPSLLEAHALSRHYGVSRGLFRPRAILKAVDGVSFCLASGETLAVVGESGSGKSTLARLLAMIEPPSAGRLLIEGSDVAQACAAELRRLRPRVQMVFQNPAASLNPRQRVAQMLDEPLALNTALGRAERSERAAAMLRQVGLQPAHGQRFAHMLSGGQHQRVAIARAMVLGPRLLVADEPTSALDVTLEAQIIELLEQLRRERGTAIIFISHDLGVVSRICDRLVVMYAGRAIEEGDTAGVFASPLHPYTQALLAAIPSYRQRDGLLAAIPGRVPSLSNLPPGCKFADRCPVAQDVNRTREPELVSVNGRRVRCNQYDPSSGYVRD